MDVRPFVGTSSPFAPAAQCLSSARSALRDAVCGGLPTLGICLGVQLLFSGSEEAEGEGLGVLDGDVTRVRADRVPHIGWNRVESDGDPLLQASGLTSARISPISATLPLTVLASM